MFKHSQRLAPKPSKASYKFMKSVLTKIFWPILALFESSESTAQYKKSHRTALKAVGGLFLLLSFISAVAASVAGGVGALVPVVIFFCVGVVAIVVGTLGSDSAVSRIWSTRKS